MRSALGHFLLLATIGLAALLSVSLPAQELTRGNLPLETPLPSDTLSGNEQLIVRGRLEGAREAMLIVRIDDNASTGYASRYNLEQTLLPGPFELSIPLRGIKATGGRLMDLAQLTDVFVFSPDSSTIFSEVEVSIFTPAPLPEGSAGYSFGETDAPVFPGFQRVTPESSIIESGRPTAVRRTGSDPLITNGINGMERVVLPWREGDEVDVHLWTEDIGEWEHLPHPLERRININDHTVFYKSHSIEDWVRERYLEGKRREVLGQGDAWTDLARYRGGYLKATTTATSEGVRIDLAGDSADATYLSAVLLTPKGDDRALNIVLEERARIARAAWPVVPLGPREPADAVFNLTQAVKPMVAVPLRIAAGTGARLSVDLVSDERKDLLSASLTGGPPEAALFLWAALRTLDRPAANASSLSVQETRLLSDVSGLTVAPERPRRVEIWVSVPPDTPKGTYPMQLAVTSSFGNVSLPINLEVLESTLPPSRAPAGFYMDEAPHLTWAWQDGEKRVAQLQCDIAFVNKLGLSPLAPGLITPTPDEEQAFFQELSAAKPFAPAVMAYTPAKRLIEQVGIEAAAVQLQRITQEAEERGLSPIYWSVADEPSNPDMQAYDLPHLVDVFREVAPDVKLAAQLNSEEDRALARLFDLVLINDGYGLQPMDIRSLQREGLKVWLYNTRQPRMTAALGVLVTGAEAYVQWHSRMPTADPFDPTDGREGDVMMLLPSAEVCPSQPDIHSGLLDMAEGVVDQRWLLHFGQQEDEEAQDLKWKLWKNIETLWWDRNKSPNTYEEEIKKIIDTQK
ncbi:hypothetical protein PUV47_04770 [Pseudovibrio exalbescens]|uniref:hypothetical protein n=1 Tax=Pseudovibrio exalbescens TaxID=197461 RepID=UPI0023652992|nr:hypothetical protein [Pseudovibrio exalbescens]MDD7909220.1 hypothetical protein [Pseudovibrio exalbescens]